MPQKKKTWSKKGSTKLSKAKKFNWKKYLPIVAVVALVGGLFVWRSFAGTKLYNYQYSVQQCDSVSGDEGVTTNAINPKDKCVGTSAEAMVYRLYGGLLAREPDQNGYAYWTQKLAGDRETVQRVAQRMIGSSKTVQAKSNRDFVKQLYVGAIGRANPSGSSLDAWQKRLDNKSWSRHQMAAHFASEQSAIDAQAAKFANYLKQAKRVEVQETAKKKQLERLYISAVRVNDAKKEFSKIDSLVDNGRKNRDVAKSQAGKRTPSRSDLTAIAANEKTVRGYKNKVPEVLRKITIWKDRNKALYDESKKVSDYSPDLFYEGIKSNYDKLVFYEAATKNVSKDLDYLIKDIARYYKIAENKYEAELRRQEAARRAAEEATQRRTGGGSGGSGGSGGGGSGTTTRTTTETPPASVGPTNAQKRAWCNSLPTSTSTRRITGGRQTTTKNPSWYSGGGVSYCRTYVSTKTTCNYPFTRSGSRCVRGRTLSPLPYEYCGNYSRPRCIKRVVSRGGNPRGITKIYTCSLSVYNFGFKKYHNFHACRYQSGYWRG